MTAVSVVTHSYEKDVNDTDDTSQFHPRAAAPAPFSVTTTFGVTVGNADEKVIDPVAHLPLLTLDPSSLQAVGAAGAFAPALFPSCIPALPLGPCAPAGP